MSNGTHWLGWGISSRVAWRPGVCRVSFQPNILQLSLPLFFLGQLASDLELRIGFRQPVHSFVHPSGVQYLSASDWIWTKL